jgi:NADPH2:quinone reductase
LQQAGFSHASFLSVPWTVVTPVPSSVSTETAAGGLLQALTAVTFAHESFPIAPHHTVFVHTVAGGLGSLLAQYASNGLGAHVIGTTSTPAKAAEAKKTGAARDVILYRDEDTVQRALELTKGEGVDVIYDGLGKDT